MKAIKPLINACVLSFCAATFAAQAQTAVPGSSTGATTTSQGGATMMSKDQINDKYKMDKKNCDGMQSNAKDVCMQKAKTDRDTAKANAKEAKKDSEAHHDAQKDKMNSQYKLAKEKCDAMSGDAKDKCVADAKAQHMK